MPTPEDYWKNLRGGVSAETFGLEEKAKQLTGEAEETKRKGVAKLIIEGASTGLGGKPVTMSTFTAGEKLALQPLIDEKRRVEAGGQSSFGGGSGEYNPFKDPFRVGEFAQKEKMGAMLGEASALEKMTPTQRAYYENAHKGRENIPSTSTNGDGHVDLTSDHQGNKSAYDDYNKGSK